ncbi:MAG: cation-translocating P-type ATPase [Bifidobacterium psychraerophilum]|jgi:potassium/sodium efflux P-type ATPase|uniref:Calcium-transporting ATPase n=1 Tax=Bifidobacterium psychraerophilum TaxID=218140 RepID=A0A087CHI5_9BIFI|nr:cation-translocating P-type ATPase [Bifidobacterium psychraerophilum]KFI82735.1 Calcium-transporting ATPase [Bifidobacterium psychraerophilum]MCI1659614.1 cation-translocating P-type ATPase [Bifidobacterium psychraerophilum]MCI1804419.1 cation-translocating P-type ATPase [Bifidobacterium psychraerophilum]MCI2176425.1 cation-translocating P-type ATPase [Bifidobacterium psychraerophilum]MCI2181101.1 cation-translocating P-type ATPase [Bifidobacterium psychraerophilum]
MTGPSSNHIVQRSGGLPTDSDPSLIESTEVAQALDVDIATGLSSDEAKRRLEEFGANELASAPPVPKWKKFLEQFKDPLVYLLLAATLISLVAWFIERSHAQAGAEGAEALPFDSIVIVLILVLNAVLGYLQEVKAEKAVDALAQMTAPQTSVLRDGRVTRINTSDVVPGDVVVLGEGDTVSADGRLVASASLRIAEASLTGESVPVGKRPDKLDSAKALGDRANMVFNGTSVTQGTGRVIVTGTGMNTQVGKIADMLSQTEDDTTPLQKEMAHVSKVLGIAVCIIAVLVLVALAVMEGFHSTQDVIDSLLLAVSLAVAAVPEGLAAILTVVLALGVQRMAQHHAIVKKLSSVETLGSASVICSDKTGTLTRNEMTVERVLTPSGQVEITGTGYAPVGQMTGINGGDLQGDNPARAEAMLTLAVGSLANDGELRKSDAGDKWEIVGDPTEVSLVVAARKIRANKAYENFQRVAELPFTSERKRMSIIAEDRSDARRLSVFAKGAPDVLLGYCSRISVNGQVRPLTEGDRQTILQSVEELSSQAYRTLGQAYRPLNTPSLSEVPGVQANAAGQVRDIAEQSEVIEKDLIWTGMVGIIDPPRTEVRDSVAEAHRAGIRTVMITGDHPLTAARIASDLGIIKPGDEARTGEELDAMSQEEFDKTTSKISVYARVAPEHKLKIVDSLQRQQNIVAMTGDGVNDAPAVKTSDIGVAMGITGTEVTKESAKMILADDNFSTIVAAVREGRVIFDNIRKFLRYLLSSNVGEVFTVFGGVMLAGFLGITQPESQGVTLPLLATQLLWINLLTDAAPALAMGIDPQTDDVMGRSPRRLNDRVIDKSMWGDIIFIGIIMAIVTLIGMDMHLSGGLFTDRSVAALGHEEQMVEARTMGFTILVFAQLFNAVASRSALQSAFVGLFSNKWLWGAIGISIALQVLVIYVPFLNTAFGTTPLGALAWFECIGLAAFVLVASELRKVVLRAIEKRRA